MNPDDLKNILNDIEQRSSEIPFGNSDFQTDNFVIAGAITPARAYRAILLQLRSRLDAIHKTKFSRDLQKIDIAEMAEQIKSWKTGKWEKQRLKTRIAEAHYDFSQSEKLIKDAIHEIGLLYNRLQSFSHFTREEFEAEEKQHFEERLTRQIKGITGAAESLENMYTDAPILINKTDKFRSIANGF